MKTINFLPVFLALLTAACSKQQKGSVPVDENNKTIQTPSKIVQWKEYRDSVYLIAFNHPIIPLKGYTDWMSKVSTRKFSSSDRYEILVWANLSQEFPDYPDDEDDGIHPLDQTLLVNIIFHSENVNSFVWWLNHPGKAKIEETFMNSIPMLRLLDPKTNEVNLHIPLIPGYYITIEDAIYSADKFHQPSYQRIKELTEGVLKSLRWERPIDTNTHEFKDWKKRILWFVDKGSKMPELLDTERLKNLPEDELKKNKNYQKNEQKRQAYVQSVLEEAKKRWPTTQAARH